MLENCKETDEKLVDVELDVYSLIDVELNYEFESKSRFRHLTWMSENFRCGSFNDGTLLLYTRNREEWKDAFDKNIPAYCFPGFELKYARFGAIYNIHVFNSDKELCPPGWRVTMYRNWRDLGHIINEHGGRDGIKSPMKYYTKDDWGIDIDQPRSNQSDLLGLNFKFINPELLEAINDSNNQYYALADPDGIKPKNDQQIPIIDSSAKENIESIIFEIKNKTFKTYVTYVPTNIGFFVRMVRYNLANIR